MSQASITVSPKNMTAPVTTVISDGSYKAKVSSPTSTVAPAEAPKAEAKVEEAKAPEAAPKVSAEDQARFDQLARREKAIRTEAKKLEQMRKDIDAQKAPPTPAFNKAEFLKDPMKYVTADELSQVTLAQLNQSPESHMIRQLQAELEALKQEQGTVKQSIETQQTTAYKQAVQQISREVDSLVSSNDDYAAIQAEGAQSAVVQLIEQTYQEDGILLTSAEAAKQVEDYLLEKALKLAGLAKVQTRLAPKVSEAIAPTSQPEQQQQSRTLTNSLVTSSKPLTARERRERAILAYQGKLS